MCYKRSLHSLRFIFFCIFYMYSWFYNSIPFIK
eukprot:UN06186